jgi:hypothetical protein
VFKVIGTSVHAEISTPEEFFTVSFALVNVPVPALVRVKDCQLRIGCELASHPILGTMEVPEKDAVVGAPAVQLLVPSTTFKRKVLGLSFCIIHKQFGATGSMTAV